jgi:Flp pilus assembly protein TadG
MKSFTCYKNKEKGATAVELALILPLLIIFIFGIIEFSLLLYNKNIIKLAAREGARVGIVYDPTRSDDKDIEEAVSLYIDNRLVSFSTYLEEPNVLVSDSTGSPIICPKTAKSDTLITVSVDYTYTFLLLPNFIEGFFSGELQEGIPLRGESVMLCE